jgi:hypothetical protein
MRWLGELAIATWRRLRTTQGTGPLTVLELADALHASHDSVSPVDVAGSFPLCANRDAHV